MIDQIRIHGAAGTSASRILQTDPLPRPGRLPPPGRMLSRRSTTEILEAANPIPDGYNRLAAFRWGNLTSGTPLKAVTALFTAQLLVNTAGWMMPSRAGLNRCFSHAAIRVAALSTSGFVTVGLLWFFYVVPSTGCQLLAITDLRSVTDFKATHGIDPALRCRLVPSGLNQPVAGLLALLSAAALPATQLARSAGLTSRQRTPTERRPDPGHQSDGDPDNWADRMDQLERSRATTMLRVLHLVVVVTVVGLGIAISNYERLPLKIIVPAGLALLTLTAAAAALVEPGCRPDSQSKPLDRLITTVILVVPLAVYAWITWTFHVPTGSTDVILAQFNLVNSVVVIGALPLLLLLGQTAVVGATDRWAHFAALSVAALSLLASGVIAAGLGYFVVVVLDVSLLRDVFGGNLPVAVAFVTTLSLSFLFVGTALVRNTRRVSASTVTDAMAQPVSHHPGHERRYRFLLAFADAGRCRVRGLLCGIGVIQLVAWATALWVTARFVANPEKFGADPFPATFSWAMILIPVVLGVEVVVVARQYGLSRRALGYVTVAIGLAVALYIQRFVTNPVATLEQVALLVPLAALAVMTYHGFTDSDSRRGIGVVADLAGFWPRTFHPLAPRPYSGIAVRDLQNFLRQPTGPRVVAAHSQGTVLATLALSSLDREQLDNHALITYGSPLGVLYPTVFPGQFVTDEWVTSIYDLLGARWVNLGRDTDPIAGEIPALPTASVSVDNTTAPVSGNWFFPDLKSMPSIHSGYEREPPFRNVESMFAEYFADRASAQHSSPGTPSARSWSHHHRNE